MNENEIKCYCGANPFHICTTGCVMGKHSWPAYHQQKGCICPPGANKECENQYCPRKPVKETE